MCDGWQFISIFLYWCLKLMAPSTSPLPVIDGFVYHFSLQVWREMPSGVSTSTLQSLADSQSQELCSPSRVYATEVLEFSWILITF